jgi:hypothetical protein
MLANPIKDTQKKNKINSTTDLNACFTTNYLFSQGLSMDFLILITLKSLSGIKARRIQKNKVSQSTIEIQSM